MLRVTSFLASSALIWGCSGGSDWRDPDERTKPTPVVTQGAATNAPAASADAAAVSSDAGAGIEPSAPTGDPAPPAFDLNGQPLYSRAIPLTHPQWTRSVQDVLELTGPPTQAQSFVVPVAGFTTFMNNERVLEVSSTQSALYQSAAKELADVMGADQDLTRIVASQDPAALIATLGRRAYRRPLTAEETARYQALYDVGASTGGKSFTGTPFAEGSKWVIEAMLQSPHFLYRTELGAAGEQLSGFEIAAKLSLWLRGTTPSDALLDQAEAGELDTLDDVASLASTMIEEPSATASLTDMHVQLFRLRYLREIVKDSSDYDPATSLELEQASLLFFNRVYESGLGLREILTDTVGYMGPGMASLYGLGAPMGSELVLQDLGQSRPGFFSQLPLLAMYGTDVRPETIRRGAAILNEVLCGDLPIPPVVVPPLSPILPGQTNRERVEQLTGVGTCGEACHVGYINPLGFAFENFDGLGRERTLDLERPIDTTGSYPFVDGLKAFDGAAELMQLVAGSTEAHECYARNMLAFALQRDITAADQAELSALGSVSNSAAGSLKNLVLEIVKNPVFHTRSSRGAL
jgi:Protein of unknown function (DUF1595)/Protein of unknown function (DUF1588)/Protein of unknown function (DUF1592)/Protein of unknown function (DUF1585)/Protein of unknown function (DUF1587)